MGGRAARVAAPSSTSAATPKTWPGNIEPFAEAFPDRSLYLVNYRGYGGSSGRPSEAGLVADALAVFDHVRTQHPDIAVMGRSLGSGVAVQLAAVRPVDRGWCW